MAQLPADTPAADTTATTRLVLRDGSTAGVRLASPADRDAMRQFFHDLSPTSRRRRFLASTEPSSDLIDRLCDNTDPHRAVTLVVSRHRDAGIRLVGVGSYFATAAHSAEVAFAVDDRFHGRGMATALLERLVVIASDNGFLAFEAVVLAENSEMLDVFRDSGFEIRSNTTAGCVDVRLVLAPSATSVSAAEERDRIATIASLRAILEPRAVAVIGASRNESNLGRRIFDALITSPLPVYPVNPAVGELNGLRCYSSARELPSGVDLAVVAVPRDAVLAVVDDCAAAGVKGLVVISAGFAEHDEEGRRLQDQLVERVRAHGMRLVGPNCMGILSTRRVARFNASFAERMPAEGRIALASQSGGLGLAILELAARRQVGLSTFVSLGNKADVSGNDLLQYGESDPATSTILLYLESFGNPRRFARLARRISRKKPIVVVKAGRTAAGTRAASSHTAGLAASELAVDGLFRQSGVIRAETIDEMFDVAALLDAQPLPAGRRVAIVTNAGGPGILAADACSGAGLSVGELSGATRSQLSAFLASVSSTGNPIDMVASAGPAEYRGTLETLLCADDMDAVIAIYTTVDRHRTNDILTAIQDGVMAGRRLGGVRKPVLVCTMASARTAPLHAGGETLPIYEFPEQAARALGKAAAYAEWIAQPEGSYPNLGAGQAHEARAFCQDIIQARGETWLTLEELRHLLEMFGLRVAPGVIAQTAEEAATMAKLVGFPVAMKIVSSKGLHKTELGGVRLNLANEQSVRTAFTEISARVAGLPGASIDGMLVQPMFTDGVETIVGLTSDPMFGPLVAFGLGGVTVEVFRDVAFRVAPLSDREADDLMRSVRGFQLLKGDRGHPPADLGALRDLLWRVSSLGAQVPELLELDLNPVIARSRGYELVDARARGGPGARRD
jgi:acetyl coenzyme A synthetase (ADP forming)-like protein